jgi:hypothetical protein
MVSLAHNTPVILGSPSYTIEFGRDTPLQLRLWFDRRATNGELASFLEEMPDYWGTVTDFQFSKGTDLDEDGRFRVSVHMTFKGLDHADKLPLSVRLFAGYALREPAVQRGFWERLRFPLV